MFYIKNIHKRKKKQTFEKKQKLQKNKTQITYFSMLFLKLRLTGYHHNGKYSKS
jgi:hypothetical protein